ncbi:RNase A-like domain-containing protein, partial [Halioxenophilus aromaticivorans]
VTRKPITVEQLASLNEEQPKPVAPTPIERLNIEFPNRRKSNRRSAVEMPPLTERQSATVDEIHASLVSSGIKGVGKPEVAEYVTKREALTKQATLLESGTWYRGKAHDLADKNREVARLDYEFARRSDQVGLETSTPVLNVLGLGGVTKAATTQAVGKVAKSVTAKRSAVPKKIPLIKTESGGTLIFHENLDGHTIRRHVGKSDQRLLKRFDSEPDILGSSTYPDIETAQRVVGNVLSKNQAKVREWLSNSAKRRLTLNETLDYEVGRVIPQGAKTSQPSNKSFVLLIKDPIAPKGYRVHTSFPKPNN